jgi:hypothetical protein
MLKATNLMKKVQLAGEVVDKLDKEKVIDG